MISGHSRSARRFLAARHPGSVSTPLLYEVEAMAARHQRSRGACPLIRIYPWRRTRRFRAPSNGPEAFFVAQFSAGYTTNMFGFDLRQGQVILKDVLDQSLEEIAAMLDLTVNAVKAHLARGRARLNAVNAQAPAQPTPRAPSPAVARYVALFNRRDWDGLRTLLADDVRLIQSTYPLRAGAADVGMFFGIYSRSAPVRPGPACLNGRVAI